MELTVEKFKKINDMFCLKYSNKIFLLRKKYLKLVPNITVDEFKKLNKLYRIYINDLVRDVIHELKKYYEIEFCAVLSGSLARHTNTLFSDIDINYLTLEENKDYSKIVELEDKINYILQNVLKFRGKDRIHSMVIFLPLISDKKPNFISENKYELKFTNGIIYVKCRDNAEKLMYETYNSTRNLYDVINYFNQNDNILELNEWSYCFEFIYNEQLHNIYNRERKLYRKHNNIKKQIIKLIEQINCDTNYLDCNCQKVTNANFKKMYKTTVLFNFYKMMAIFYRLDHNIKKFNLDDFYKNGLMLDKKVFYYFNKYLMIIQNIQYILNEKDLDLSSHNNDDININDINYLYKKIIGRDHLIKDLNRYKKKLYEMCILNLERVLE